MNIRIIGLGNVLMSDDGFGPYVTRVLEAFYEFPPYVQAIDAGAPGIDLKPYLLDADAVIFIDTVTDDGKPGEVREYRLPDILRQTPATSPHDAGIRESLMAIAAAGAGPREVLLVGVIPEWVATGVKLSRVVRGAIAPVVGVVSTELQRLGCQLRYRQTPRHPDTWWERDAAPLDEVVPS